MLRNIIWDVDGTLFDTYPAIARAIKGALNDLGCDAPLDHVERLARVSLGRCVADLADRSRLSVDDLERAFQVRYARRSIDDSPPFPGVIAVCRFVRAIDGRNVIVTHRGREGTVALLEANGMLPDFAALLTADDGYPRKPDPAAFDAAITTCHLQRAETLTVGDRAIDVEAGRAAGILTCRYGREDGDARADLVIDGFDQLLRYLARVNGTDVAAVAAVTDPSAVADGRHRGRGR